uniref:Uncharacterized protein n=1 Tax=Chromera velia CCMP2878 TaxID=1169474 RepID=A0A0G4H355_9ALVE|eukprot:Cvel_5636.t1-p1 / transcript=Cvel_5636.t1 / gene=Cvel_5636 / organism=Chromera_velia_CCMP2878 / gene_product=hypothetical protein / transcript_product=hypothetical protein / location=Cvel_scaffold265:97078-102314(+) / protein_length=834 / sequence_SO=supercontig / SO=protein_coding / is_pseudo=false
MSRPASRLRGAPPEEGAGPGAQLVDPVDAALSAAFGHARPTEEEFSALVLNREGFGMGWVLLQFIRTSATLMTTPSSSRLFLSLWSLWPSKTLRLARTGAREKGTEALAEVLKAKRVTSLCSLDLEENEMGVGGFKHLGDALCTAGAVPRLRVLILKKNDLTNAEKEEGERDYAPLSAFLSTDQLRELEELDLRENRLFDERLGVEGAPDRVSAAAIAAADRFPKLRILNLANSCISSEETAVFANALGEGGAPLLEDLDLSEPIGLEEEGEEAEAEEGVGVQALATALSADRLSHLTRLRLVNRRDLTGGAVRSLFEAMADGKTPNLCEIHVDVLEIFLEDPENPLGCHDEAVEALARAVEEGRVPRLENLILELWRGNLRSAPMSSLGKALGSGGVSSLPKLELRWFFPDTDENPGGGVLGVAECLGGGFLPLLEDLTLRVGCRGREGGAELGEVLSTGKVPSLRKVALGWPVNEMLSALCEGLCVGSSPPSEMRMELYLHAHSDVVHDGPISSLAKTIRSGRMSFLWKMTPEDWVFNETTAETLGAALTHEEACLAFLEEISLMQCGSRAKEFLQGMRGGTGRLPSLRILKAGSVSLSSFLPPLITAGKLPSLRELNPVVNLVPADHQGCQALAASLCSPHAASLRRIEVSFDYANLNAAAAAEDASVQVGTFCASLASEHLSKLQVLTVTRIREAAGVRSLCAGLGGGKLSSLRELKLREVSLASEAQALSSALKAEKLPGLRVLKVISASLTDDGVKSLTKGWTSQPPPPLQHLDLSHNKLSAVTEQTLKDFLISRRLPALLKIVLTGNTMEDGGLAKLRLRFPDVTIL